MFDVDSGSAQPMVTHLEDALPGAAKDREPLRISYKGRKHFDALQRAKATYPLGVLTSTDFLEHRESAEMAGFEGVKKRGRSKRPAVGRGGGAGGRSSGGQGNRKRGSNP